MQLRAAAIGPLFHFISHPLWILAPGPTVLVGGGGLNVLPAEAAAEVSLPSGQARRLRRWWSHEAVVAEETLAASVMVAPDLRSRTVETESAAVPAARRRRWWRRLQ